MKSSQISFTSFTDENNVLNLEVDIFNALLEIQLQGKNADASLLLPQINDIALVGDAIALNANKPGTTTQYTSNSVMIQAIVTVLSEIANVLIENPTTPVPDDIINIQIQMAQLLQYVSVINLQDLNRSQALYISNALDQIRSAILAAALKYINSRWGRLINALQLTNGAIIAFIIVLIFALIFSASVAL
jgi:hypothetical protein